MRDMSNFLDLNMDDILESWSVSQAVRELLANALDEQVLTSTPEIIIEKQGGSWIIQDFGRGIQPTHFVLKENPEKLGRSDIIGKFGYGLKDALGTLYRQGVEIEILSSHGTYRLGKRSKTGLNGLETLHVIQSAPTAGEMRGTRIYLRGLSDKDMQTARNMFLKLADPVPDVLETLPIGQIIRYRGQKAPIFVNGLQVGEEARFLFGYNLISPPPALMRALNRERRHVGRTAYVTRVKELLLQSTNPEVAKTLAADFAKKPTREELTWLPVQEHAIRLLNRERKHLFYKDGDAFHKPALLDEARNEGLIPIELSRKLWDKVLGQADYQQAPILTLEEFARQRNANFQPAFVSEADLTASELQIWKMRNRIFEAIGGRPAQVREICIAESIVIAEKANTQVLGLWSEQYQRITIRRDRLRSISAFSSVLLHEIAHAKSGADDCTRRFELELTDLLGRVADAMIRSENTT